MSRVTLKRFETLRSARALFKVESASAWLGFSKFIRRADILDEPKGWLKDGAIIVEADIAVYTKTPPLWHPPSRVINDFVRMFESGADSDVTFVVGGERVSAHRFILLARFKKVPRAWPCAGVF